MTKTLRHCDLQDRVDLAHYTSAYLDIDGWSLGDTPLFSIVMPLYNKRPYLAKAIDSVLRQSYKHFELIIVDDASTDGSFKIAESFAKCDERIKIFRHESTLGCATATNRAVAESVGVICGILDADDALHPKALSKMLEGYRLNPCCGFGWSQFAYCDVDTLAPKKRGYAGHIPAGKTLLQTDCATAFRTFTRFAFDACGGIGKLTNGANDKDLFLRLEEVAPGFFVDELLYFARQTPNRRVPDSITDQNSRSQRRHYSEVRYSAAKRRECQCELSIIMPHYGKASKLPQVLDAYRRQFTGDEELVLVDRLSPYSQDIRKLAKDCGVTYIPARLGPYSAAASRNLGIQAASGRMLLFSDSNCLPSDDLVFRCKYKNDEHRVTVFDIDYENPSFCDERETGGSLTHWRKPEFRRALMMGADAGNNWRLVMGAGTLVSRFAARRTLFNEGFCGGWGCDDTFFGLQLFAGGQKIEPSMHGRLTRLDLPSFRSDAPLNRPRYERLRDYYLECLKNKKDKRLAVSA